MPISGSGRTVRILGRGVREIDRQLLYSAAWLDDPRPADDRLPAPAPWGATATSHGDGTEEAQHPTQSTGHRRHDRGDEERGDS